MTNPLLTFIQEFLQRLFTKSPLFFRIWTIVSAALLIITGVPEFLQYLGIVLPDSIAFFANQAIAYAAAGALLMSKLTTQSTAVATTTNGTVLKTTDETKLPFTAQIEVNRIGDVPEIKNIK